MDRIVAMREAGKTYEQIGRALGCSAKAVSWHCLRLGADSPRPTKLWDGIVGPPTFGRNGHTVRRYTVEDDALLLKLERQGLPIATIAQRMGRRWNSVKGRLMTLARRDERSSAA
jgi:hypothetical protein